MIGAVPSPAQTFSFFSLHIQDHLHSSKLMSYGGLAQKDHVLQKLAEPYCHWQRLFPSMGTYLKLILVAPCDSTKVSFSLNNIHEKIDNLLNEIETKLSLFQEESEVSRLNREGTLTQPSKHLSYLINQAQYHGERTRGYFDFTGPKMVSTHTPVSPSRDQAKGIGGFEDIDRIQKNISCRKTNTPS
jgi:hypothetical protein